jgi:hypothetical protein
LSAGITSGELCFAKIIIAWGMQDFDGSLYVDIIFKILYFNYLYVKKYIHSRSGVPFMLMPIFTEQKII